MEAHLLSLNDFYKPKVLSAADAGYMHIIYLILLSKGKYQSHPDMGVGIRERYRYSNSDSLLIDLENDIKNQIEKYLPELQLINISLNIRNNVLGIIIDTTTGAYVLAYDRNKDTMDAAATYILNDL